MSKWRAKNGDININLNGYWVCMSKHGTWSRHWSDRLHKFDANWQKIPKNEKMASSGICQWHTHTHTNWRRWMVNGLIYIWVSLIIESPRLLSFKLLCLNSSGYCSSTNWNSHSHSSVFVLDVSTSSIERFVVNFSSYCVRASLHYGTIQYSWIDSHKDLFTLNAQ